MNFWIKQWKFRKNKNKKKIFITQLPPPNITGKLHIGHNLEHTIMDILIRYKYFLGYKTIFIPGIDHAGIATQLIVKNNFIKKYNKKNIIKKIFIWKNIISKKIINQILKLGLLLNWKYKYFTLNKNINLIIKKVFKKLFKKKIIYKKSKLVNWDYKFKTVVSDLEIKKKRKKIFGYYIRYYFNKNNKKYIIIFTTKPETLFGDTALAISFKNKKNLILNKIEIIIPILNKKISIIKSNYVKNNLGTGILKITPFHDFNDYKIYKKNNLKKICIFKYNGKLNKNNPIKYQNIKIKKFKKIIIKDLIKKKYIQKKIKYLTKISYIEKTGIIPLKMLTKQWFLKIKKKYKKKIFKIIKNGEIKFIPNYWKNTFYSWINNMKEWCISRQIFWGHRIPIYYKKKYRDKNVLDTWFSSSLIPIFFYKNFKKKKISLPFNIIISGFDIIFFWIIKMIIMTLYIKNKIPFKKIIIHGLICDSNNKKMSKSKGNIISYNNLFKNINFKNKIYFTDILRFTFSNLNIYKNSIIFKKKYINKNYKFINKLLNGIKFIKINLKKNNFNFNDYIFYKKLKNLKIIKYSIFDIYINSLLQKLIINIKKNFSNYKINKISKKIYNFIWNEFCNFYIQVVKKDLKNSNLLKNKIILFNLINILKNIIKLINPIMPFFSEKIWKKISFFFFKKKRNKFIFNYKYPIFNFNNINNKNENFIKKIKIIKKKYIKFKNKNLLIKNNINLLFNNIKSNIFYINLKYIKKYYIYNFKIENILLY